MGLTKDGEHLLRWAAEQKADMRSAENAGTDSYWQIRTDAVGIRDYGAETFKEMQAGLEGCIEEPEAALVVAAAMMRGKEQYRKQETGEKETSVQAGVSAELPDYVYVF